MEPLSSAIRTKEIRALTGLRGVAALTIVVYHYQLITIAKGYLAVDLFFVLSGFVMALTYSRALTATPTARSYLDFLWKRVARVYPIYAIATVVTFFLPEAGMEPTVAQLGINLLLMQQFGLDLIRSDLGISIVGQGWSISAELAAYLLFPIILAMCLGCKRATASIIAGIALLVIVGLSYAPPGHPNQAGPLDHHWRGLGLVRCQAEFVVGVIVYRIWKSGRTLRSWAAAASLVSMILLGRHLHGDALIVGCFAVIILAAASTGNLLSVWLGREPFHFLGEVSYSLYLLHILPYFYLRPYTDRLVFAAHLPHARAVSLAILVIIDIILAAAALRFIEKPARKHLRALTSRRPVEPLAAEPAAP